MAIASALAVYFLPALLRPDVFTNDAAQHISWMYRFSDPRLFPACPMRQYFSDSMAPFGFRWLYRVLASLLDVQTASELLAFPLALITLAGAFQLGRWAAQGDTLGGFGSGATVLLGGLAGSAFNYMQPIAGGLQRSFSLPILVWGVVATVGRRPMVVAALMVIAALFYPPVCVLMGMFAAIVWVHDCLKLRCVTNAGWPIAVGGMGSAFILWRMNQAAGPYGTMLQLSELIRMPDFYPGGVFYTPILFHDAWGYVRGVMAGTDAAFALRAVLLVGSVFLLRARLAKEAWLLVLSGCILYVFAYGLLFRLYEPSRYTQYAMLIFQLMAVAPLFAAAASIPRVESSRLMQSLKRGAVRADISVVLAVAMAISAACAVSYRYHFRQGGMTGDIPDSVYRFLRTLPVNALIVAHPLDANYIPLRSQHCVPLVADALNVRQREFRQKVFGELNDILSLMYAQNVDQVRSAQKRIGSSIYVVNAARYADDPLSKTQPVGETLAGLRSNLAGSEPLLMHPPARSILFRDGPVSVVDLDLLSGGQQITPR